MPWIIESSVGVGRSVLAFITDAYTEESLENGETRTVLKFNKNHIGLKNRHSTFLKRFLKY